MVEIPIPFFAKTKHCEILKKRKNSPSLGNPMSGFIKVDWDLVSRNSGDENHVVMNEKVQALAGSIYEEFEKMLQRWSISSAFASSSSQSITITASMKSLKRCNRGECSNTLSLSKASKLSKAFHASLHRNNSPPWLMSIFQHNINDPHLTRYDQDVVKNLMPLIVNVLESLDLAYTESSEFEVIQLFSVVFIFSAHNPLS